MKQTNINDLEAIEKVLRTCIGEDAALTATEIQEKAGIRVTGEHFRQIIHELRVNHYVRCLCANRKGYFISNDPVQIQKYINSLRQRIGSIQQTERALITQLQNLKTQ